MCTFFPGGPLLPGVPGSPGSPGVPGRPCSSVELNISLSNKKKDVPFFRADLVPLVSHLHRVDLAHHLSPILYVQIKCTKLIHMHTHTI